MTENKFIFCPFCGYKHIAKELLDSGKIKKTLEGFEKENTQSFDCNSCQTKIHVAEIINRTFSVFSNKI
jgi:DNA-directed RNA polymerase subunit RPC12/RpoP